MLSRITIHLNPRGMITVLGVLGALFATMVFHHLLVLVVCACLLAIAVAPVLNQLTRRRVPRTLALVGVYTLLVGIGAGVLALLLPPLLAQAAALSTQLPQLLTAAWDVQRHWVGQQPPLVQHLVPDPPQLLHAIRDHVALRDVGSVVSGISTMLTDGLFIVIISFLLVADAQLAPRCIARFVAVAHQPTATRLVQTIVQQLGAWIRAQCLVCVFYGVMLGLGFAVLDVPYALALGVVAVVFEIIPYVGGLCIMLVGVLVALPVSPWLALAVLVWYLVVANVEGTIVYPKLVGDMVGLHPLLVMVALFIGVELLGIVGALLAVPVTVVLRVLFDQVYQVPCAAPVGRSG